MIAQQIASMAATEVNFVEIYEQISLEDCAETCDFTGKRFSAFDSCYEIIPDSSGTSEKIYNRCALYINEVEPSRLI